MAKVPKFKSDKEAAKFWDTHDSTDYLDELKEVKVKIAPQLKQKVPHHPLLRSTAGAYVVLGERDASSFS